MVLGISTLEISISKTLHIRGVYKNCTSVQQCTLITRYLDMARGAGCHVVLSKVNKDYEEIEVKERDSPYIDL